MRILLICERLSGRDDEGVKNVARNLVTVLSEEHDVLALSEREWAERPEVVAVRMNKLFLNRELWRRARRFAPDVALYLPWTSGTPRTLLRARVVRAAARCPVALLLSQPYRMRGLARPLARLLLCPDLVLGLSDATLAPFVSWDVRTEFLPAGVDLERFRIPRPDERAQARRRWDVPDEQRMILHVGHLNPSRMDPHGVARLAREPTNRVLVVGSPDTPQDAEVVRTLESAGCRVLRSYLPDIHELYWAADAYLFPTRNDRSSIAVPLSVLEALASGVSVVATEFGALPRLFPDSSHVRFACGTDEVDQALTGLPKAPAANARALVASLDWKQIGSLVAGELERMARGT